jgi:V/A-type H+-transporting ATPase subunit C
MRRSPCCWGVMRSAMLSPNHSYILTRAHILAQRLIPLEQWPQVVDSDLATLQQQYQCKTHCDNIEKQLIDQALEDFQLLFRPFSGVERNMLHYTVHWYELSNLKTLIRGKFSGMSESEIEQELVDLGQFAALPLPALLQTDDPYEMLRLLEQTPYSSIVRQARSIFEEEGRNLFALDAAIDRHFFSSLLQQIRFLPRVDRQPLRQAFGTLMDRFNLLWLIRYRFAYRLSAAKSYHLLATTGNQLHSTELMRLARVEHLGELIEQLPSPLRQLLQGSEGLTAIENRMEHYMLQALQRVMQRTRSAITHIFCYVLLRESEIHLLQSIIKGKMLEFDERLIRQAIGMAE